MSVKVNVNYHCSEISNVLWFIYFSLVRRVFAAQNSVDMADGPVAQGAPGAPGGGDGALRSANNAFESSDSSDSSSITQTVRTFFPVTWLWDLVSVG